MHILILALLAVCPLYAQSPSIVFSEIMWMGSSASSADEWIELYNAGSTQQNLRGWTITRLTSQGEESMLTIDEGIIEPGQAFLIANYAADHANSRLASTPHIVSAALSLPNNKLQLSLYAGSPKDGTPLIDMADDGSGMPLAGDSALKKSMVRIDLTGDGSLGSSWQTAETASGWDPESTEMGTPGVVPQGITATTTTRPTSIETIGWAKIKRKH